jgi:hypothetical protein
VYSAIPRPAHDNLPETQGKEHSLGPAVRRREGGGGRGPPRFSMVCGPVLFSIQTVALPGVSPCRAFATVCDVCACPATDACARARWGADHAAGIHARRSANARTCSGSNFALEQTKNKDGGDKCWTRCQSALVLVSLWTPDRPNNAVISCEALAAAIPGQSYLCADYCTHSVFVSGYIARIWRDGRISYCPDIEPSYSSTAASGMDTVVRRGDCRKAEFAFGPTRSFATGSETPNRLGSCERLDGAC